MIIGYNPRQYCSRACSRTIAITLTTNLNVRLVKRLFAIAPALWDQGFLGSSNPHRPQKGPGIIARQLKLDCHKLKLDRVDDYVADVEQV